MAIKNIVILLDICLLGDGLMARELLGKHNCAMPLAFGCATNRVFAANNDRAELNSYFSEARWLTASLY